MNKGERVLAMRAAGLSNKEIAGALNMPVPSVRRLASEAKHKTATLEEAMAWGAKFEAAAQRSLADPAPGKTFEEIDAALEDVVALPESLRFDSLRRSIGLDRRISIPHGQKSQRILALRAEGYTNQEIADSLEMPIGTVKSLLNYAVSMRGNGNGRKGEANAMAKLTTDLAAQVRERVAAGESQKKVARELDVNPKTISDIIHEKTWVPTPPTQPIPTATTRRCKNKDCIQRFVPVNAQNFFCSPECRVSTETWSTEEVLQEEAALLPDASYLEMVKRAFGQKNQAVRQVTQLASLREYLRYEVNSFYGDNPEYRFPTTPRVDPDEGRGDREIVVQLSDWQVGKLENGIGINCMREERIPRIKDAIRAIVQRQRAAGYAVNRVALSWGGDMIEGCYIYAGQNVTGLDRTGNTHRLTKQIRVVAHLQAELAVDVASYVDVVDNFVVPGNHGRPNGKNDFADPEDNFDLMAGEWSADLTANTPRISWTMHEDWWGSFESSGHPIVAFHGDQWGGPVSKLEELLPKWLANDVFKVRPQIVLTHHRHDMAIFRVAGITVSQNGTIDGGSKWYLRAYGKGSVPSQTILVTSQKRPVEAVFPVYFNAPVACDASSLGG